MRAIFTWILLLTTTFVFGQQANRLIDYSKSTITFKIKNAGIGVSGTFKEFTVDMVWNSKDLSSAHIDGKIKVKSIDTGINARDNHLRNKDYFEVDKYADMSFHSTSIKQQTAGVYWLSGKLTIKDVTKEIGMPLTMTQSGNAETMEGNLTLNRLDFHVGEDSWVMSNEVMIHIKITTK
jgi:polyisoprenoid-binding protein YceI